MCPLTVLRCLRCSPHLPLHSLISISDLSDRATGVLEDDAGTPSSLDDKWVSMMIRSPATLYTLLYTAAAHYAAVYCKSSDQHIHQTLWFLKGKSLASIQNLTSDLSTSMSDTVISAEIEMASCEAMFGSRDEYHIHMRGIQISVEKRGGLDILGFDGLLKRRILCVDSICASDFPCRKYFSEENPSPDDRYGSIKFQKPLVQ